MEIVEATYMFLDNLDKSALIKDLTKYKNRLLKNKELLKEIDNLKKETENNIIITKRKEIFGNTDYSNYMKCYNELSLIVLKINKKYQEYTNTKEHNCGGNNESN